MKGWLKNLAHWICQLWRKIPVPVRAIGNLAVCTLVIILFAVPMLWKMFALFIPEVAFRYDEQLEMFGPSKILGTLDCSGADYNKVVIAEDDDFFVIYAVKRGIDADKKNLLNYVYKQEDLALVPLPFTTKANVIDIEAREATFLLIDEYPAAVRAEMDLQIVYPFGIWYDGQTYTISDAMYIGVQADRYAEGCFVFDWSVGIDDGSLEALWKQKNLAQFICHPLHSETRDAFDATVRLYDASGRKILEEKIELGQLIDIDK